MRFQSYALLIFLFLFIGNTNAQQRLFNFNSVFVAEKENIVTRGTKLKLNRSILESLYKNKPEETRIFIPIENEIITVRLQRKELFSKEAEIISAVSFEKFNYTPGYYLQGKVEGETHSFVAISIFHDYAGGIISYKGNNYNLAIANNRNDYSDDNYVIYADKDFLAERPKCFTKDDGAAVSVDKNIPVTGSFTGCPLDMYFELSYTIFQNQGSIQNAMNYFTILFNGEQALFAAEDIKVQIREIRVWTGPEPETGLANMVFMEAAFSNRIDISGFNGDLAHLVTFADIGGGAAVLNGLCGSSFFQKTAVSGNVAPNYIPYPNYSYSVEVTCHEIGHNIGSPHTHSCTWPGGAIDNCFAVEDGSCPPGPAPVTGGTVMSYCHLTSYGINFANGFGTLPGNLIRSKIAAASCICNCGNIQLDISKQNINCTATAGSATAIVTGGTPPYQYLWSTGATSQSISGLAAGTYYVTARGTNQYCRVVKGVQIIDSSVHLTLNPSASSVVKCVNQSYTIAATIAPAWAASFSFQWYKNGIAVPGATAASITINSAVNATSSYYLIVSNGSCSIQSATTSITFVDIPVPSITVSGPTAICDGQSVVLLTDPSPYFTEWFYNGVPIAGATSATLTVNSAGIYRVRNYYAASGGCSAISALVNISVLPLPDATIVPSYIEICDDQSTVISHAAIAGENYQWFQNNTLIPGALNNSLSINTAGNYQLQVQGANGCYNTSTNTTVVVNPLPDVTLVPPATMALCEGGTLPIIAVPLNQAQYAWYHGNELTSTGSNNSLNITEGGTYSVVITNGITGCTNSSAHIMVTTYQPPAITASNDTIIAMGQPYMLNVHAATSTPVDHFIWEPSTGLNMTNTSHPTTTLSHDQEYIVKGYYEPSGCFATDKVLIRVLKGPAFYIPSAFSPNDDNQNDILKCIAVGIKSFKYLDIYNRYGQRVFHSTNLLTGWDGKWNGKRLDVGTYVYMVEGQDFSGKPVFAKGTVTIIL